MVGGPSLARRSVALALAGLLALPGAAPAHAREPAVPLEVPVPEPAPAPAPATPSSTEPATGPSGPVPSDTSQTPAPSEQVPSTMAEGPAPLPPRALDPGAALQGQDEALTVAVGIGPTAPGTRAERELADALERSARGSSAPRTTVRRLRVGVGEGKQVCRERRDDLVILIEYLPDRPDPVLLAQDCRLDRPLGVRGADAATHPELIATLWAEHDDLVRQGAQERRRGRLGPKVRTGLIVGGAILAVGVAIGFVVAASLRREIVVLTVSP